MANNYFSFKKFTIHQDGAAMKVGTDGVIIGAWCKIDDHQYHILDIGTGTGLIALMAAQRTTSAIIDAIEIDGEAALQAKHNVSLSQWGDRVMVYCKSLQEFAPAYKYDHIVSNPPYFVNSLKSVGESRTKARHTDGLPYDDLARRVNVLLADSGRFSVILPFVEANLFVAIAAMESLYCVRRMEIRGVGGGPVKRVALEFSKSKGPLIEESLIIESSTERGSYTEEYRLLTADFYIKF